MFLNATAPADGGMMSMLPMLLIMVVVFYFFLIRPENKKKKEAAEMRNALKVGDNITIGGIIGDIVSVKEETLVLETSADKVRVEFAKWAVSTNNTAAKAAAKEKEAALAARKAAKKEKKN